jgi:ABC-2 type transport system ATP-binding protein
LLDEPFVGLDAETRERVWASLVARARAGATIVISSHDLYDVGVSCDQVAVVSRGRLLTLMPPRQLVERYAARDAPMSLESAYLRYLRENDEHGA